MAKSPDMLSQIAEELETEGLATVDASSRFVAAIMRTMPDSPSLNEKAQRVSSGLERLLARHHDDSRRIISASVALGQASEFEIAQFVKKLSRFVRFLETPVVPYSLKSIKLADFVDRHPEVMRAKNVEAISSLGKLPEGSIAMGSKKDEIWVGEMSLSLEKDDLKKVNQAVRQVKAAQAPQVPKIEPELRKGAVVAVEEAWEDDAVEVDEPVPERENDLPEEFFQAEKALSKVLGRLSSEANSELSHALKEARKLLLLAMEQGAMSSAGIEL